MKHFLIFPLLVLVIACNTDKNIDPYSIYGYWESTDLGKDTANPIGLKLDLQDTCVAWIDPVVSDTIFFYNSCIIRNDSLVLHNEENTIKYSIEKVKDSILILKCGANKYIYKKKVSYYENNHFIGYITKRSIKGIPTDSLDIILKSPYEEDVSYILSNEEMLQSRKLVDDYLKNKEYQKTKDYSELELNNLDDYGRQYFVLKYEGKNYVYVKLFDVFIDHKIGYMALKEESVRDCGYTFKIDLIRNRVVGFWYNYHIL